MPGITEAHVDQAEEWLVAHDHSLQAIAHPEGAQARFMAAVALELNVPAFSIPETARLIVELIAYKRSGGAVGDVG